MATTKRRLNITLSSETDEFVTALAKRDKMPAATKISQLVEIALELEEDRILSELAEERMKRPFKKLTHEEVWGELA